MATFPKGRGRHFFLVFAEQKTRPLDHALIFINAGPMTGRNSHQIKALQIVHRLMPSDRQHSKYLSDAGNFIEHFQNTNDLLAQDETRIHRLEMIDSVRFGKTYLAAFVDREWFHQFAANCDAVATSAVTHFGLASPPIVVLPGKMKSRKPGFASIIEHEIVHVNQAIIGQFPSLESCRLENRLIFKELMSYVRAEYEAHFVQLAFDPTMAPPPQYRLGIEKWCHLRGFTSGLEILLERVVIEGYSESKFMRFIDKLRSSLPVAFKEMGLIEKIGLEFANDLDRMLEIAMGVVEGRVRPG